MRWLREEGKSAARTLVLSGKYSNFADFAQEMMQEVVLAESLRWSQLIKQDTSWQKKTLIAFPTFFILP